MTAEIAESAAELSTIARHAGTKPVSICYVIGSLETGGAEFQLIQLLRNIDRDRFAPQLVLFDTRHVGLASELADAVCQLGFGRKSATLFGKSVKAVRGVARLTAFLKAHQPQIVHAILPASCILAAPASRLANAPILIGSRRSLAACYRTNTMFAAADRIATRRCDLMLANTEAIRHELLADDHLPEERVITIRNGIDTERFSPGERSARNEFGWNGEHIVIGTIANFIPYKRHIDFIRAAAHIVRECPNARFIMAGEDRGVLPMLQQEIMALGLNHYFAIVPGTTEPERLYRAMDIYVCSSETEGLSNVLLEAAATALPMVATHIGGNPEIVVDQENGFLVPVHSSAAIAANVLALALDKPLRNRMGAQSRSHVLRNFSIRQMVSAHEQVYELMLHRRALNA